MLLLGSASCSLSAGEITPLVVTFVDVGHGDCIWIRTPDDGIPGNGIYEGSNIIIDGGPSAQRILELLPPLGLRRGATIEWMINTHAHNDHYRGLVGILGDYRVKRVADPGYLSPSSTYRAFCWTALIEPGSVFYFPAVGVPTIPGTQSLGPCVPVSLNWGDELQVEILHSNPLVSDYNVNDSSMVIRMSYGEVSFLFTGDLEGKSRPDSWGNHNPNRALRGEKFLLDNYLTPEENRLRSTILKIPHHGSETSSTIPFIEAVGAQEGIIMAGRRYGLPDESVIERYQARGTRIWRTDRGDQGKPASECAGNDTIIVTTDGQSYLIAYRDPEPALAGKCPAPPAPPAVEEEES